MAGPGRFLTLSGSTGEPVVSRCFVTLDTPTQHVAALHHFFRRESGVGQNEPSKHVRVDDSFRRKRPWLPLSQYPKYRDEHCASKVRQAAPRWRLVSMRFRARPISE